MKKELRTFYILVCGIDLLVYTSLQQNMSAVNEVYEYNEVHLDSLCRDSGTNDHPIWNVAPELNNVLGVKVLNAQLPFTFDTVHSGNNQFAVVLPNGGGTYNVTLDPGNYDVETLPVQAKNKIAAAGAGNIGWTWQNSTGRWIVDGPPGFSLIFDEGSPTVILGFPVGTHTDTGSTGFITSPNTAVLTGPTHVYLVSRAIGPRISNHIRMNGSRTRNAAVLAKIPIDVNPGSYFFYNDISNGHAFDAALDQFQEIDLALEYPDKDAAHECQLHGSPWSVSLMVLTQRDVKLPHSERMTETGGHKRLRIS